MYNLFQTWKTQNLNPKILKLHSTMLKKNNSLSQTIYTDTQMIDSVMSNFNEEICSNFKRLNNVVAKADYWRYLMLYKYGGVYLDIDSLILDSLNSNYFEPNTGYISLELNKKYFIQWSLIYDKDHPVLKKCIENIGINLKNNLYKNDISSLTGPKLYTKSILETLNKESIYLEDLVSADKKNSKFEIKINKHKLVFVPSNQYDKEFLFKHKYTHLLNNRNKGTLEESHWTVTQSKQDVYN